MSLDMDPRLIVALLDWQAELGADEWIGDAPVDRFALAEAVTQAAVQAPSPAASAMAPAPVQIDPVAEAQRIAARARTLEDLAEIQAAYPHCELRRGARNFVFSDGRAGARVMLLGDGPGADEDRQGKPFAGRAGELLDRMLAAIGIDRQAPDPASAAYIATVLPWRPPGDRSPDPGELAMMQPFVHRHIELAAPDVLVLLGNHACQAVLGETGITRLRGQWSRALGLPVLSMLPPDHLLRNPAAKREAWADLLSLQARLRQP